MAEDTNLGQRMFATYQVKISGIQRTQANIDKLDGLIKQIRGTQYTPGVSSTVAANLGTKDVFRSEFDEVIGHVQEKAIAVMNSAMKDARDIQTQVLRAAVTKSGTARMARGVGNGPGRDLTGTMISEIQVNVEVSKNPTSTNITGSHGWGISDVSERGTAVRTAYLAVQEKGNRNRHGIIGANSLGVAIPIVREKLKADLKGLTK